MKILIALAFLSLSSTAFSSQDFLEKCGSFAEKTVKRETGNAYG